MAPAVREHPGARPEPVEEVLTWPRVATRPGKGMCRVRDPGKRARSRVPSQPGSARSEPGTEALSLDPPIGDLWGTERSDRQGDEANVVAWSAFIGRRGVLDQAFVKFTSVVSAVQRSSAVRRPREVGLHGDRGQGAQKVEGAIECVRPRPLERRS